jgi:hypothetical protein
LSAPVRVASCFRSGVTEMYPGCPAGVAMIIYGSSCIYCTRVWCSVVQMTGSFNGFNLAAKICADDPSIQKICLVHCPAGDER